MADAPAPQGDIEGLAKRLEKAAQELQAVGLDGKHNSDLYYAAMCLRGMGNRIAILEAQ